MVSGSKGTWFLKKCRRRDFVNEQYVPCFHHLGTTQHLVNKQVSYNPTNRCMDFNPFLDGDYITCPHLSPPKRNRTPSTTYQPNHFCNPARKRGPLRWLEVGLNQWNCKPEIQAKSHPKTKFLARKWHFSRCGAWYTLGFSLCRSLDPSPCDLTKPNKKKIFWGKHHGWVDTEVMRETLEKSLCWNPWMVKKNKGNRKWWAGENERFNVTIR